VNTTHITTALLGIAFALTVPSCNRTEQGGPPKIMLGDSTCRECGMIISDERFATATVIQSEHGKEALLFDDFNCQLNFEHQFPDLDITNRWSHDYSSLVWFETESGSFVKSPEIRSPMASGMAIFQDRSEADAFSKPVSGEILEFETAWTQNE